MGKIYTFLTQLIIILAWMREKTARGLWRRQYQHVYPIESFEKYPEQHWECCDCGLTHLAFSGNEGSINLLALRHVDYYYKLRYLAGKPAPSKDMRAWSFARAVDVDRKENPQP